MRAAAAMTASARAIIPRTYARAGDLSRLRSDRAAEEDASIREFLVEQRSRVGSQRVAGDGRAVHRVDPVRMEVADPSGNGSDRVFVREDSIQAVRLKHLVGEVLGAHRRLL